MSGLPLSIKAFIAAIALVLVIQPIRAADDGTRWVEAVGHGVVHSKSDNLSAKRRAVADALLSAALSGGALVRGHTYVRNANVVSDAAIIRPTGQVLEHRIISEQLDQGVWQVRIQARVGPSTQSQCTMNTRRMDIAVFAPRISVSPKVPAWVDAAAHNLPADMIAMIQNHPAMTINYVSNKSRDATARQSASNFDYNSITRGNPTPTGTEHQLEIEVVATRTKTGIGKTIDLQVGISLTAPDGDRIQRVIRTEAPMHEDTMLSKVSLRNRTKSEKALLGEFSNLMNGVLNGLACEPPSGRVFMAGNSLTIPVGLRHGVTKGSLAFVNDKNDSFGILEIVKLSQNKTVLKPLDPTRSAQSFDGMQVYFLETGL